MECIIKIISVIVATVATVTIAIFTGFLWYSTKKLWKTTENSIKLASDEIELTKQEFVASHPPKLRVHSVSLNIGSPNGSIAGIGKASKIQFYVDNIGGSDATIKKCEWKFTNLGSILPPLLPPSDESHRLSKETLAPGAWDTGLLQLTNQSDASLSDLFWGRYESGFYFFGYIDYLDNIGIRRRTAFCRQFNPTTRCFIKVENEDYEYSY